MWNSFLRSQDEVKAKAGSVDNKGEVVKGFLVPGLPHILLAPEQNPGWGKIRSAFDRVKESIESSGAELLLIYSTYWPSILGHQIQAFPEPEFVHVDEEFHSLGSIHYRFLIDSEFAETYRQCSISRGLHARTVAYSGFPIDTGSVVALKLLNPDNRIPAVIVSSNIYSDRGETLVFGKAGLDAVKQAGKKVVALAISSLSNRLHTQWLDPSKDKISSLKDDEWNRKYLEFLVAGRLEDASQLSRQFHREARINKVSNFKPIWWLAALMGQSNSYIGELFEYQAIHGTGAAVVGLTPGELGSAVELEFDEEDPQSYQGERNVLGSPSNEHFAPMNGEMKNYLDEQGVEEELQG